MKKFRLDLAKHIKEPHEGEYIDFNEACVGNGKNNLCIQEEII